MGTNGHLSPSRLRRPAPPTTEHSTLMYSAVEPISTSILSQRDRQTERPVETNLKSPQTSLSFSYSHEGNSPSFLPAFLTPCSFLCPVLHFSWLWILWLWTATCPSPPMSFPWAGCPAHLHSLFPFTAQVHSFYDYCLCFHTTSLSWKICNMTAGPTLLKASSGLCRFWFCLCHPSFCQSLLFFL